MFNRKILKPSKVGKKRVEKYKGVHSRRISKYIKNRSKGDLDLSKSPLEYLPDGLKIGGDLILDGSNIKKLPEDIVIGGDLGISYTNIKYLPNGLSVDNLYASYSSLNKLPKNFRVKGMMFLTGTPLKNQKRFSLISFLKNISFFLIYNIAKKF
jgi:hypothetical protein